MTEFRYPAPAKLNLMLRVVGRRDDGYHLLQTVYQLLDWGDRLHISATPDAGIRRLTELPGISESDDLGLRAARLLQQAAGVERGAEIAVEKNIPAGAGLGGGSSDAATVLQVLNELWGLRWSHDELAQLGLELGADVPLFVKGHSAFAEGVGELLQPLSLGQPAYLLVMPDMHIATAEVFSAPELKRDSPRVSPDAWRAGPLVNDCETVVRARFPKLEKVFTELAPFGKPRLTGTGSAVFVEMADYSAAERAASELNCRYNARAVRGVDRSPLLDVLVGKNANVR